MKNILMALSLTVLSTQAFAKMTVFSGFDAVKLVLTSEETMTQVTSKVSAGELAGITVSATSKDIRRDFTVRITQNVKTPIGNRPCYTDVSVGTVTKLVGLPGGGPGISSNKLVIKNVASPVCAK